MQGQVGETKPFLAETTSLDIMITSEDLDESGVDFVIRNEIPKAVYFSSQ